MRLSRWTIVFAVLIIFASPAALLAAQSAPKAAVKRVDKNKDGKISAREGKVAQKQVKKAQQKRIMKRHQARVRKMDQNGDGKIDLKERRRFWLEKKCKVNNRFEQKFDADGNGFISGEEARKMLRHRVREVEAKGKMKANNDLEREFDENEDGEIDGEEAAALLETIGEETE